MSKIQLPAVRSKRSPWNKGRLVGQKRPLLPKQVWAIRARLELAANLRDLALFNLAIDSKLRGCDLVRLRIADLVAGESVRDRVTVIQSKTNRPVQFECLRTRATRSGTGFVGPRCSGTPISSQADFTTDPICRHGNMRGLYAIGYPPSALIRVATAHIRSDAPRRPRYIGRPETYARCSFCLATLRSTARFDTLVLSWKTP